MSTGKKDIWVYAHWRGMADPVCLGILSAHTGRGNQAFSFTYDEEWLQSKEQRLLDPDIGWYTGPQFPRDKVNFGVFLDSMPDRWGRTLLQRRAAQQARQTTKKSPRLTDIDYLLGVFDESRMGALRFKTAPDGPFLDNNPKTPIPPISEVRTLQAAAAKMEDDTGDIMDDWLHIILAPGSSLGGARPKANVRDEKSQLWIAKFPAKQDEFDKGAWEYVAYTLAQKAGIQTPPCQLKRITGKHHTFFSRRFDRLQNERIHFASAMTMTGHNEDTLRNYVPSYLELAEFLQFNGIRIKEQLHELWKRIVFNILISNTDDHLRNHGFLLTESGWVLSPAYDMNPSIDKNGLALNINMDENRLDVELAMEVAHFFQVSSHDAQTYLKTIGEAVQTWEHVADTIGIPKAEQKRMSPAFRSRSA